SGDCRSSVASSSAITPALPGRPRSPSSPWASSSSSCSRGASRRACAPRPRPSERESAIMGAMTSRPLLKWNYYEPDVLAAWVAEMDFGLAPAVTEALHRAVDLGDTGYPYPALEQAVAEAATGFWKRRFGVDIEPHRVFSAPDVIEGGRRAIVHLTEPGSPVVLHPPVYFPFYSMVERAGREVVEVPAIQDEGGYRIDVAGLDRAFADGAGSVVLCNPWNPVARSLSADEVAEVVRVAARYWSLAYANDIRASILYDGRSLTMAASIDTDVVITVTSSSKAFNLPGLKAAQVVLTSDRDVEVWQEYFTPDKVGVGTFGLVANAAAYAEGEEWLDEVMERLHRNREILAGFVGERLPRVKMRLPEATFLAWLDFTDYGWDDPATVLLERARVALSGGIPFGPGGEGHARFNFATTEEILVEILERMEGALQGYLLRSLGSRASRRPSPTKFTEITVSEIITPGQITRHGLVGR